MRTCAVGGYCSAFLSANSGALLQHLCNAELVPHHQIGVELPNRRADLVPDHFGDPSACSWVNIPRGAGSSSTESTSGEAIRNLRATLPHVRPIGTAPWERSSMSADPRSVIADTATPYGAIDAALADELEGAARIALGR